MGFACYPIPDSEIEEEQTCHIPTLWKDMVCKDFKNFCLNEVLFNVEDILCLVCCCIDVDPSSDKIKFFSSDDYCCPKDVRYPCCSGCETKFPCHWGQTDEDGKELKKAGCCFLLIGSGKQVNNVQSHFFGFTDFL